MNKLPLPTLGGTLAQTQQETGLPIHELRILLSHVTGINRVGLITHDREVIPFDQLTLFKALANKRTQGEPIAYLVGEKEFFSRMFLVNPDVLIPRPETEELVERALAWLASISTENLLTRVLDLGCGSGVIGITLALENPILEVTASDISHESLATAQKNATRLQANNIQFIQSDIFNSLGQQQFDLIVSNPPYIDKDDIHLSQGDLRFEPAHALTDGFDGFHFYRKIAKQSKKHLRAKGAILVEHGHQQQIEIMEIFKEADFSIIKAWPDLAGIPRIVMAQL